MSESVSSFEIETASAVLLVRLMKAATAYFPGYVIKLSFVLIVLIDNVEMIGLRSHRDIDALTACGMELVHLHASESRD